MDTRLANGGDGVAVVALVNDLLLELGAELRTTDAALAAFSDLVGTAAPGAVIVGEEDDKLVGVCTLSFQLAIRTTGRYAIVQEMYVVPGYRGKGLGARLIERATDEARAQGCRVVELTTPPDGSRQEHFYSEVGFAPAGTRFRKTTDR